MSSSRARRLLFAPFGDDNLVTKFGSRRQDGRELYEIIHPNTGDTRAFQFSYPDGRVETCIVKHDYTRIAKDNVTQTNEQARVKKGTPDRAGLFHGDHLKRRVDAYHEKRKRVNEMRSHHWDDQCLQKRQSNSCKPPLAQSRWVILNWAPNSWAHLFATSHAAWNLCWCRRLLKPLGLEWGGTFRDMIA